MSRILKFITGAEYNHVSISLDPTLQTIYSFGRLWAYNPFTGGFVKESISSGTFKRFYKTKAVVLSLDISQKKYDSIGEYFEYLTQNKRSFHYNYLGLFLAVFRICYTRDNRYYCSEFVKNVFERFSLCEEMSFSRIPQPIHFLDVPETQVVYRGELQKYSA